MKFPWNWQDAPGASKHSTPDRPPMAPQPRMRPATLLRGRMTPAAKPLSHQARGQEPSVFQEVQEREDLLESRQHLCIVARHLHPTLLVPLVGLQEEIGSSSRSTW